MTRPVSASEGTCTAKEQRGAEMSVSGALAPAPENNIHRIPFCSWAFPQCSERCSAHSSLVSVVFFFSHPEHTHCLYRLHNNTTPTQQGDACVVSTEGWFMLFHRVGKQSWWDLSLSSLSNLLHLSIVVAKCLVQSNPSNWLTVSPLLPHVD